ncbi:MAG: flippase-like domain-containing protein [Ignavibacteriae bacterium]|nr:flippase-like domain-containing protein [Ignavibacteriota bacterium]
MKEGTKTFLRFTISFVIIIASIYYAVKDINFNELFRIIVNADYFWIILSVPVIILSHWIRAMRWKTMLEPAMKKKSASVWNLFSAVMIGYAANCVLPRGGEFLRPYVYSRREKISFTTTFATIIVERFIDVITLILLFGVVFLFLSKKVIHALPYLDPNHIIVPVVIIFAVLLLSFYPPFVNFVLKILIKPVSQKLYDKINTLFEKFLKGFAIIRTPRQYLRLILESIGIWFLYTVPMFLMFFSFDFQSKFHLGFNDATILIVISGIGATIAPTPGAIGVYHVLIQNAMVKLYGISSEEALAYATLTHAINYLVQVGIGGIFFFRENIRKLPHRVEFNNELEAEPVELINQVKNSKLN